MTEFLLATWLATPVWMWLVFVALVIAALVFDLGVLNRRDEVIGIRRSLMLSTGYITLGLAFAAGVWWHLGSGPATDFLTGFVVEKSLAMDNIFVIAMIFSYFAIPPAYQHRILFWGILGVIVLRALIIGAGAALLAQAHWVLYLFALFLILTGIKMWKNADKAYDVGGSPMLGWVRRVLPVTDRMEGSRFWLRLPDAAGRERWYATPLFLALLMVELVDIVFAVDSVPAIFAITDDPFIVYTSNIFAILGLRALYFALSAMIDRFAYLKYALAALLVFIGSKIILADALGLGKVPASVSLGITFAILATGIGWSLWKTRGQQPVGPTFTGSA